MEAIFDEESDRPGARAVALGEDRMGFSRV